MTSTELNTQLNNAIGAHGAWKLRLRMAAQTPGGNDMSATAGDHRNCEFGRWLESLPADTKSMPEAQDTIALHAAFHQTAGRTAQLVHQGKKDAAITMLDTELADASNALKSAVSKWKFAANQ
ncbi:CZB domain-containing protein [Marivita sp.]|uniref:CZB domain-containing protein n=1 Tax=Marivita sp. TaxID=2003365 RepID=UPI003F6AC176